MANERTHKCSQVANKAVHFHACALIPVKTILRLIIIMRMLAMSGQKVINLHQIVSEFEHDQSERKSSRTCSGQAVIGQPKFLTWSSQCARTPFGQGRVL